jgi:integrase
MNQRVARELELVFQASRWQDDDDLVFAHPAIGGVQDPSALRKRFKGYLKAAEIERRLTWHMLRNTFGTSMAAAGAPLRSLMEWMGHSNIQTTMIYADYSPDPSGGVAWAERAFAAAIDPSGTFVAQQELLAAI